MGLYNKLSKAELQKRLQAESFRRITFSFYRYVRLEDPTALRDELYRKWDAMKALGRIYLAKEGINAQMNVPEQEFERFRETLYADVRFKDVPFKIAVEDDGKSFLKLVIKVRNKIVADGLPEGAFDVYNVGKHLTAEEFNNALDQPGTIVVDMRNHYESEVGKFKGAICPDVDTFREELEQVSELLKGKEDQKVLMYCTGGVRCEKASAWMKHKGFKDVNQLYGGIIEYARQVKQAGLPSKFIGKNFVFDERLGERITEDVIASCHQCGKPCDDHTNCANDECHLLFIQCAECREKMAGCCSETCKQIAALPIEEQRKRRKGSKKGDLAEHKSRLRPRLK